MQKYLLATCLIALAAPALAQPDMGAGPPGGGPPGGGAPRMKEIKPVTRAKFDKIVTAMFASADRNRDGIVALDEIRAIAQSRREAIIAERFSRIDANSDGAIQREEFLAWQRSLGSAAQTDGAQVIGRDGPVPETIDPEFSDPSEARLLSGLIEPLSTGLVVKANINYDGGISLEELLAYEGKRFEEADRDGNGAISMAEARRPEGRFPDAVRGLPPGRPREPIPDTP